jgi:hypothetical protein
MVSLSTRAAPLRYPKRKRTEVNYHYSNSESDAIENSDSDIISIKVTTFVHWFSDVHTHIQTEKSNN